MVDQERVDRLLARIASDLRQLSGYRERGAELLGDRTELAAAKYYFITAIEGCARVAQHLIAAEGWLVAETNADAVRRLGSEGVLDAPKLSRWQARLVSATSWCTSTPRSTTNAWWATSTGSVNSRPS